jgi:prepilin-type N-terminal cleavage/methylation domain-containing protein
METHMRDRGFAFVEVALGLVILAIIASIVIMAMSKPGHVNAVTGCQHEAVAVADAVHVYHERHGGGKTAWPSNAHHDMGEVQESLLGFSNLSHGFRYLDGSQHHPVTQAHGWTYNFNTHTVDELGCESAP